MNKQLVKDWLTIESRKDFHAIRAITFNKQFAAYTGWTGYGNLGDEAVQDAYKKLFPEYKLRSFNINRPIRTYSKLTNRDIPIKIAALGGGTLINQSPAWLHNVQYFIDRNIPTFCLGTGVASKAFWGEHPGIHDASEIQLWAELLRKFVFVGVRGPLSQKDLSAAGVKSEVVGDSAISLAPRKYKKRTLNKVVVGINVSYGTDNVMYGNRGIFLNEISRTVANLLNEGFDVRILPIWRGDLSASREVVTKINNKDCYIVESYKTLGDYLAEIEKCNLFIGQKLHATIFSTMLRVPSIMLEYRPKCLDYMDSLGLSQFSVRTDKVSAKLLISKVHELIENHRLITLTLDDRILHYKNLQTERAKYIKRLLGNL